MASHDALSEETFDGDVIEKIRKQVEPALDESKTVEDHGFEHPRMAEMVVTNFRESSVDHAASITPATMPRWPMERIKVSSKPSTKGILKVIR